MTASNTELDGVVIEFIDEQQGKELLEQQAQKYLNMSGEEFARAYCAGELDLCDGEVIRVYFLLRAAGIECDDE